MQFTKMHACGNDFVFIELFTQRLERPEAAVRLLADRHRGAGCDCVILLGPSVQADCRMRVFNPDGSEAEMCGNALRCAGKFMLERRLAAGPEVTVETRGGTGRVFPEGDGVAAEIALPVPAGKQRICFDAREYDCRCFSMGNPHCTVEVEEPEALNLPALGGFIEHHPLFPDRTNVEFYVVADRNTIRMRAWERGCGETFACATGSCACAFAGYTAGRLDTNITVLQPGGAIGVTLDPEHGRLLMRGETVFVYTGETAQGFFGPAEERA